MPIGRPPTLNGITKAAWTNDETQTSFVIIFKLSHGIVPPPLPPHSGPDPPKM
jgi:hypothetical protein